MEEEEEQEEQEQEQEEEQEGGGGGGGGEINCVYLPTETERHIIANNPEFNAQFNYAKGMRAYSKIRSVKNYIKTSKYTLLNFVPYNLFEQFQRLANFYFLCLLVLQLIPVISSLSPITTAVPLIGVLTVTAAKDAYDDFQRHRSDRQVNSRKTWVLKNGQLVQEPWSRTSKYTLLNFVPYNLFEQFQRLGNFYFLCLLVLQTDPRHLLPLPHHHRRAPHRRAHRHSAKDAYDDFQRHRSDRQVNSRKTWVLKNGQLVQEPWSRVLVGDVIRMENDEFVAADILLLTTSEPNGLCYIETSELDGETNLKCKQCLPETEDLGQNDRLIGGFQGEVHCEPPNNQLNKFDGTLNLDGNTHPLDNDKILLRGCILRNTSGATALWCLPARTPS
ncbi:putative phospholipid-transporting ATPase IM [Chionoecetes opilio]|uniref:Putative phospholipid-transporting ATPase IM n=1 Tax=Chionoecetes opilio TaxID=41210 RepID=A0A8J4XWT8_CHIOP|nr:putative phospholipid-transporting ATPase IM [Chionoecetes opilio]